MTELQRKGTVRARYPTSPRLLPLAEGPSYRQDPPLSDPSSHKVRLCRDSPRQLFLITKKTHVNLSYFWISALTSKGYGILSRVRMLP